MSAEDFELPPTLEALVVQVCAEQGLAVRRQDEIRELVSSDASTWPVCCGASCQPCVEDSKSIAREILARWAASAST